MLNRQIWKRVTKCLGRCLLLLCLCIFIFLAYVYLPVISSPVAGYAQRKGHLQSATTTRSWQGKGSDYHEMDLLSDSGLKVQITLRKPTGKTEPMPVALLLGGIDTGRDACSLLPTIKTGICVSMSYPYFGKKKLKGIEFLTHIREIQQTVKDTPPAMMLTLDYVLSQNYIDPAQVELVGVSFGSYFVSVPAVLDQRFTRVWIAHGAAEPLKAMSYNYKKGSDYKFIRGVIAYMVGYALGAPYLDPEKWVGRIAPRPVIIINARQDATFPESSVKALHDAAKEPKQIIWTQGEHVMPSKTEIIDQLTTIVLSRIESDFKQRRQLR